MNVFEKIVEKLEALKIDSANDDCPKVPNSEDCETEPCCASCFLTKAISIVQEVAEEYNNGWIACSERLPEEKENPITQDYVQYPVMVNINGTVDMRYYFYGEGHWRFGFEIKDKYVTHWMDIKPLKQEGE